MSLDIVGVSTRDKFFSLPKISAEMIPQSHKPVEICFGHCKVLDRAKVCVVVSVDQFEFYIQADGVLFGPR